MHDDPFAPIVRAEAAAADLPKPSVDPRWRLAAAALDEHERGLLARMALPAIAFFVVIILAAPLQLEWLVTVTTWVVPIGVLLASVFAIRGATRFARLPAASPARVAAVLMGVALVVDLLLALLRASEPESYAEERARTLQILLSVAAETLLVTIAIFLMLAAFTRVAKALGRPEAQKSAMGCAVLMATVTFLVAPLAYVAMSKGSGSPVMIFILGLVLGVVGMVLYMRTVRTLVEQLEERAAGTLISLRD